MSNKEEHNCIPKAALLSKTKLNIEKFGLEVIMVNSTEYNPPFAYSVGLQETYNHPEIICFGLPTTVGHSIINDVAEIIKNGEAIKTDKEYFNIFKNSRASFLKVDTKNLKDYFGVCFEYYKSNYFSALQLVWTDRDNKFPWEPNFDQTFIYKQPLLDRNADFKFREQPNTAIFTTRQWLELGHPILNVVHDDDGDWQFLTGDQEVKDARIVALKQIVLKDKTLNELFNLEYGEAAKREFVGGEWTRSKMEAPDEED